jgi:hypothetical protein
MSVLAGTLRRVDPVGRLVAMRRLCHPCAVKYSSKVAAGLIPRGVNMYTKIQVVFDAADPGKLAEFWAVALDYVFEPPPKGHENWEDFARSIGLPEEESGNLASVIDPVGEGPRLHFKRVPEGKTAKNRVHLDVRVAGREVGGEERKQLVSEKVEQLVQAGATLAWKNDSDRSGSVVLRDPEGNEFCVT